MMLSLIWWRQGRAAGDSVTDRTLGRCWSTDVLVHGSHNFRGAFVAVGAGSVRGW